MAFDYRQVKDLYDTLHDAGVVTSTLPEWSGEMNRLSGTDLYGAGLHDNIIKRASVGIDRLLEATGLPELTASFGRGVGETVGDPAAGERIGRGLPRTSVNFAPFLIPGGGAPAVAARLGLTGLLSGSETYTATGSPAAGVLSGATAAGLPYAIGPVESAVLGKTGSKLLANLAGQATAAGVMEGSSEVQSAVAGQPLHNPLSVDTLLNLTLGQLPFAALHIGGRALRGSGIETHAVDTANRTLELRQAAEADAQKTPIERIPDIGVPEETIDPKVIAETKTRLAMLRGEQIAVRDNPDLTPEQKFDETNRLLQLEGDTLRTHDLTTGNTVLGDSIQPDVPRTEVLGRELKSNGRWRALAVSDDEGNPPELRGKIVSYSTAYEPNPVFGVQSEGGQGVAKYSLPAPQWRTIKSQDEWNSRFKTNPVTNQPELPTQENPATDEQLFSHIADLKKVEVDAESAQTPADLQAAIVRLQNVEHENNLPPTNDAALRQDVKVVADSGLVSPDQVAKVSVKARARKVARILAEQNAEAKAPKKVALDEAAVKDALATAEVVAKLPEVIDHAPIRAALDEVMSVAQTRKDAQASFDLWKRRNPAARTDFQTESERYQIYWTLRRRGIIGSEDTLSPGDLAVFNEELKKSEIQPDVPEELKDYPSRLYVNEWDDAINERLHSTLEANAAPKSLETKAGDNWLFSIGTYDPTTRRLNEKHVLPKSGDLNVASFRNMVGVGKPLTQAEVDLYKVLVPEAFKGQGVNVPKLMEGLKTKGPVVETKELGNTIQDKEITDQRVQAERDVLALQHQLEGTELKPDGIGGVEFADGSAYIPLSKESQARFDRLPERTRNLATRYIEAFQRYEDTSPAGWEEVGGRASYSMISPKPESEMSGYVEGLVRVPVTQEARDLGEYERGKARAKGLQYQGPHFGSEDTNVLAFYRGYEETLPNGEKAFHVIEVQSDWGQARRERAKAAQENPEVDRTPHGWNVTDHPLLRVYESLALKAAIAHAKEIGATKVIVSDAETAMMTEGHDRAVGRFTVYDAKGERVASANSEEDAKTLISNLKGGGTFKATTEPQQGAGMRLHYDQTLPSAMEKLTGEKGQVVDLGQHKSTKLFSGPNQMENVPLPDEFLTNLNERDARGELAPGEYDRLIREEHEKTKGSPVFRDATGQPKTQITGRAYDISNVPDAFSLTDPNRAPRDKPFLPDNPVDVDTLNQIGNTGTSANDFLLKSENPLIRTLAQDLVKFPDALNRISVNIMQTHTGGSHTYDLGGGNTRINVSHAHLDNRTSLDFTLAHELVHGLTLSELNNPTKAEFVTQFDDMRQRLIAALPKSRQAALTDALNSDWYGKWQSGKVPFESLYPDGNANDRAVLYSLLRTKEMVAQGLSSKKFQDYLRGVRSDGKTSWFSKFTNTVKRLLGFKVEDTMLGEFLTKTDALLEHGDYVSSFRDFSDRYFEGLGMSDGVVQANTRRALGIVLDSGFGTSSSDILNTLSETNLVRSSDVAVRQRDIRQMFLDRREPFEITSSVMDELGYNADMRGVDDFTNEALQGLVSDHQSALDVLPEVVSKYVFAKVKDMKDVLGVLKSAVAEGNKGLLNLADPAALRGPVKDAAKMVDRLLETQRFHEEAQQIVDGLHAIAPDGYLDKMVATPEAAPDWVDDADKTKKGFGSWVKNFLQPTGQLARSNPETAEALAKGYQLQANSRKMMSEGLKAFGVDLDALGAGQHELSEASVKRFEQSLKNPRLERAASRWIWLNQKKGKDADSVTLLPDTDPDVQKAMTGLSADERKQVSEIVTKHQISQQSMQGQVLEKMLQIAATNGATVAGKDTGLKVAQNVTLSDTLLRAMIVDRSDPAAAQTADAQVSMVQSKMSPEGFLNLLKYTQGEAEKWKLWQTFFQQNPAWSSGQRYGKYLVEFVRGKKTFLQGVESRKEAESVAEGGRITKFERNQKDEEDQPPVLGPDSIGVITRLHELESNQMDILRGVLSPEDIDQMRRTSPVEQFATEEAYRGGVPNLRPPPRGLTKGAEELPWLQNHFSWVQKTSTFWSRQLLRAQARAHLLEGEVAQNPELQKLLKTHFDNMLQPDTATGRILQRTTSIWFMGFNPASALVNATQPFLTHVAEMTALTGKIAGSYRRTLAALAEVGGHGVGKAEWRSPDHSKLIHDASQDGELDYSMFDDQAAAQESVATNYKRVLAGNRTQTLGQRLSTAAGVYTTAGMWMFRGVERVNNMAALLSSFDYYREQGLGYEAARDKAYEFNHAVNYGGGRAQRPVGAFSGRGAFPRTVAMTATALQNYVLGTTFQLTRYIQKGFFRPAGITPHEVYASRKAAVQMLGTQLLAAGTLGLPFVSGALALLNAAFPDLELNKKFRETMSDFFSGDQANGNVLSDAAMTGLPSMLGWDLQSRLSMGNTVPGVSEINGFQPELLLGAPANLVSTFVKGGTRIVGGDVGGGVQSLLPSALKKIVGLGATGGEVKDYRDRPLFTPTLGETAGLVLGFQPKRLSDFNAAARMSKQSQDATTRREGQFNQSQAEEVLRGNFGSVRQALLARAQQDTEYSPVEAVRTIARAATELAFPRDLRREGSQQASAATSRLLSTFRLDPSAASEVDRLKFQQQVEARLGLRSSGSQTEERTAAVMDSLRQRNPETTRAELRRQAERLLRSPRISTLLPE